MKKREARKLFYKTCRGQSFVGAVFRDCLERTGRSFDSHKFFELWNPDAFGFKIRHEVARRHGCDVHADTAFFLRETATMDF